MGIEHVGIGTDFDGDGGITGCASASELINFTRRLLLERYSEEISASFGVETSCALWKKYKENNVTLRRSPLPYKDNAQINNRRISMKIRNVLVIPFLLLVLTAVSCGNSKSRNDRTETVDKEVIKAPEFNADSAYQYIQVQADFGPRVPNTQAHKECGEYLAGQLENSAPRYTINMPI